MYGSTHPSAALKLIDFGLSMLGRDALTSSLLETRNDRGDDRGSDKDAEEADGKEVDARGIALAYVEAAGTLEYTAPETLPSRDTTGKPIRTVRYDQAADMWSVGAILFLMLTGEPFVDFGRLRTSSAEFRRMVRSVQKGTDFDLLDDAAIKVRRPHARHAAQ